MVDLSTLLPTSQKLAVTMPDGSPSGLELQLVGQDSESFSKTSKKWAQRMLEKQGETHNIDDLELQNAELIASLIVGWNLTTPYSPEEAVKLVLKPELRFVREQVEAFASKRTNFFRSSSSPAGAGGEAGGQA